MRQVSWLNSMYISGITLGGSTTTQSQLVSMKSNLMGCVSMGNNTWAGGTQ